VVPYSALPGKENFQALFASFAKVFEEMAKIHQLSHIRDVFSKGLVQYQGPSITADLEGSMVLRLHDAGHLTGMRVPTGRTPQR
jgi:hypothetical protein